MSKARKKLGAWGEELAARHLKQQGFEILARNYRLGRRGEIDIVAQEGDCLVFVEVRTRRGSAHGTPEQSLTPAKQRRLIELGYRYRQEHAGLPADWRIDLVAVELSSRGELKRVELIRNAVSNW